MPRLEEDERDAVECNLRLVHKIARKMTRRRQDLEDNFQAGVVGLIHGLLACDAEKGTLGTIAVQHIVSKIAQARCDAELVQTPYYLRSKPNHRYSGQAERVQAAFRVTFDETWMAWRTESRIENAGAPDAVRRAISLLPEREKLIVDARMRGHTLKEIGDGIGLTRERVRQLEREAHGRLREMLAEYA